MPNIKNYLFRSALCKQLISLRLSHTDLSVYNYTKNISWYLHLQQLNDIEIKFFSCYGIFPSI